MSPLAILVAVGPTTTTAPAKSGGSSLGLLLPLLIVGALFVFLRRGRQTRQAASTRTVGIGDRVQTAGGIRGTVVDVVGDEVRVEVAPGVVMTFVNRAVGPAPAGGTPAEATDADGHDDIGGHDDIAGHDAGPYAAEPFPAGEADGHLGGGHLDGGHLDGGHLDGGHLDGGHADGGGELHPGDSDTDPRAEGR